MIDHLLKIVYDFSVINVNEGFMNLVDSFKEIPLWIPFVEDYESESESEIKVTENDTKVLENLFAKMECLDRVISRQENELAAMNNISKLSFKINDIRTDINKLREDESRLLLLISSFKHKILRGVSVDKEAFGKIQDNYKDIVDEIGYLKIEYRKLKLTNLQGKVDDELMIKIKCMLLHNINKRVLIQKEIEKIIKEKQASENKIRFSAAYTLRTIDAGGGITDTVQDLSVRFRDLKHKKLPGEWCVVQ